MIYQVDIVEKYEIEAVVTYEIIADNVKEAISKVKNGEGDYVESYDREDSTFLERTNEIIQVIRFKEDEAECGDLINPKEYE